jgi:hypothetical protein
LVSPFAAPSIIKQQVPIALHLHLPPKYCEYLLQNVSFFNINENSFDKEEDVTLDEYDSYDPPTPIGQPIKVEHPLVDPAIPTSTVTTLPLSNTSSTHSQEYGDSPTPKPAKRHKKDQKDTFSWVVETDKIPNQKMTSQPENKVTAEDEFDIFGKHVAAELRCISNVNSYRLAKLQIQQILFLAQTGNDMLPMSSTQWVPAQSMSQRQTNDSNAN